MRPFASLLVSVFVVALASTTTACRQPHEGTEEGEIEVGDRDRTYLYHHPPGWGAPENAGKTFPLVISLHGRMGQGISQESLTHMTDVADREGFIVVYPDGFRRSWHDARESGPAADHHVDDVAFIDKLIDTFIAEHAADPTRVYITGTSNGGFMTYRIACQLAGKIAAAAPVIALMPDQTPFECKPSRPVPIMITAGDADPLIPYEGGAVTGDDDKGHNMSAQATRAKWAEMNACEGGVDFMQTIDVVDDGTRIHEMRHSSCAQGSEVALFTVEGGGHTWPGGKQYLPERFIGKTSQDLDLSQEIWTFFSRHRSEGTNVAF